MDASAFIVVLVTVPDPDTAARIGRAVIEDKLAACVNVVPGLRSLYVFEGKFCDEAEVLCIIKTRQALYAPLRDRIKALHPYQVPEIIALPLSDGNPAYLSWLAASTRD